jgi:hypothetical protein
MSVTWRRHRVGEGWTALADDRVDGAVVCIERDVRDHRSSRSVITGTRDRRSPKVAFCDQ